MPNYPYKCGAGHTYDLFLQMKDDVPDQIKCHQCGSVAKRNWGAEAPVSRTAFRSYYDTALGADVHSAAEADSIAASAGLVALRHVKGALPR